MHATRDHRPPPLRPLGWLAAAPGRAVHCASRRSDDAEPAAPAAPQPSRIAPASGSVFITASGPSVAAARRSQYRVILLHDAARTLTLTGMMSGDKTLKCF
jgi:hypothetical protein